MSSKVLYTLTISLNGVFSIGFLASFLTTLILIKYNELENFNENLCENESICIFDKSAAYAFLEAGIALCSVFLFSAKFCIDKKWFSIHGWFHTFFAVGFMVFLFMRIINFGYFDWAWKDQGCMNPAVDGNPFERLFRYGTAPSNTITKESDCNFNAFNQENILYSTSETGYIIDWSDMKTYTEAQRQALLEYANSVLSNSSKFNIDTLPFYFDTYYWGCNHICLPKRYDMNVAWIWMSLAACLGETTVAVLSFWLAQKYNENELGTKEEQKNLLQGINGSDSSDVPVATIEVPPVDVSSLTLKL